MKYKLKIALALSAAVIGSALGARFVIASDHDDGITAVKSQNTNLTDLYVFTEKSQNPAATGDNLIFIMNCNPRSTAGQQFHFNTNARYEFHVTRVGTAANNDDAPTGKDDVTLRFEFSTPDTANKQNVTVTALRDGQTLSASTMAVTTPINTAPTNTNLTLGGDTLTVFAGLREDPFFFDVDQFFKVRDAAAAGKAGSVLYRNPGVDFTAGFNVLSIVARVPRTFLQGTGSSPTTFDVWETISVKK